MTKHDKRGRKASGERHVRITHFMMSTPAWRSSSTSERAVYVEVLRLYNGMNNGLLAASVRELASRCNINKDTAGKALKALERRGFLECAQPGSFAYKRRHAAEWRITDLHCDRTQQRATKLFQCWRP